MSKVVDKIPRQHIAKRRRASVTVKAGEISDGICLRRIGTTSTGERVEAVLKAAERSGLLEGRSSRVAGRVSSALIQEAKRRTGIKADSDLIAFALANVALEDNFAKSFKDVRGKVDADLKLGF